MLLADDNDVVKAVPLLLLSVPCEPERVRTQSLNI